MMATGEPKYLDSDDAMIRAWIDDDGNPQMSEMPRHYSVSLWRTLAFHAIQQKRDRYQRWINVADRWLRAAARERWHKQCRTVPKEQEGLEGRA